MSLVDEVFQLIQGRASSDKKEAELGRLRLLLSQHSVSLDGGSKGGRGGVWAIYSARQPARVCVACD